MKVQRWALPLLPLVPLYRAVIAAQDAAHASGLRRTEELRWPVISVGNLSVGGAGKTPVVIELVRLLGAAGMSPDVLSRGYGRESREALPVDAQGDAARFGDEPLLIARATGAPVFVGTSRWEAGRMAEAVSAGDGRRHVHLLDDGFQHRSLRRAVDLVLLHREDFSSRLLPAGRLREPLSALWRADVVVLRAEDADLEERVRGYVRPGTLFWRARRRVVLPQPGRKVIAFCAIARPKEFFSDVAEAGSLVVRAIAWRDHHRYTEANMARLRRMAAEQPADAFVTTAKDAVKLEPELRARLEEAMPVETAELHVRFEHEEEIVPQLLRLLPPAEPAPEM